uniref:B-cell receptor CD22 n=1 Tax=Anabas testudineus TaxID=64144 RepID=A0A3Q1JM93_ANATE
MGFTAAAGFVFLLLSLSVVQGQNDWGVTFTSTRICAVEGSTVDIHCSYRYPSRINGNVTVVEEVLWFIKVKENLPVDVRTDSEFAGRVQYDGDKNDCTLRITDLKPSDSAVYSFRFITNQPGGRYTSEPGVTLSVTVFQVQVNKPYPKAYPTWAVLTCHSSCQPFNNPSYIWYKNGLKIQEDTSFIEQYFDEADSISCAVKGHEKFSSPSVCVLHETCNRVIYTERSVCVSKGSSVNISCTYNSYYKVTSKFWFRPERGPQWKNPSQSEDLRTDSQYTGRVQVFETERGRSTLRITDLRETDSAQYQFTFRTSYFEWGSSLHGTTLTVTALQVQVIRVTLLQSYTEAELKCHSSCGSAGRLHYVWFKNGQKNKTQQTSTYTDHFYPGDNVYCAFRGHEDYPSPSVYPSIRPSVLVSPSEIVEGISVTLTCSSDTNPAAKYTWYKRNQSLPLSSGDIYHFTSISSEDRGIYYCKSEDHYSVDVFVDVQYPPNLPSVSVSPSEIVEGSSVNLTCSSDANPAANYTWYKENEESPKASGQIFTITDIRAEHSGIYYCEVQNIRGRHNSTLHLTLSTVSPFLRNLTTKMNRIRLSLVVLMLISLLPLTLWLRKKTTPLHSTTEPTGCKDNIELDACPAHEDVSP